MIFIILLISSGIYVYYFVLINEIGDTIISELYIVRRCTLHHYQLCMKRDSKVSVSQKYGLHIFILFWPFCEALLFIIEAIFFQLSFCEF